MNNVKILPILDQNVAKYVLEQAQKDGHILLQPTHYVQKDGHIIGAFNLAKLPTVNFWMHSELASIRDSLLTIDVGENILAAQGHQILTVLCKKESPFRGIVEKLGYKQMGTNFDLMYKMLI